MRDRQTNVEEPEFTLDDLVAAAQEIIRQTELQQRDGRVSSRPDMRSVRYYQHLGIVSPPLRYESRRAIYGRLHLLQLVAAKRLQALGLSLAQVQRAIAGASRSELDDAVGLGRTVLRAAGTAASPTFGQKVSNAVGESIPGASRRVAVLEQRRQRPLLATEILPGVTVLIDGAVVGNPERLVALMAAALEAPWQGDGK